VAPRLAGSTRNICKPEWSYGLIVQAAGSDRATWVGSGLVTIGSRPRAVRCRRGTAGCRLPRSVSHVCLSIHRGGTDAPKLSSIGLQPLTLVCPRVRWVPLRFGARALNRDPSCPEPEMFICAFRDTGSTGHPSATGAGRCPGLREPGRGTVARKTKPKSERRTAIAVYLPPRIMGELKKAAQKDHRTASTLAMILIERGLSTE
jgi:hypothetical protein